MTKTSQSLVIIYNNYFQTVKKEWVSPVQRLAVEESYAFHRPEENLRRSDIVYHDPYTSAPFADKLFRERMRTM